MTYITYNPIHDTKFIYMSMTNQSINQSDSDLHNERNQYTFTSDNMYPNSNSSGLEACRLTRSILTKLS